MQVVVAVAGDSDVQRVEDLHDGVRVTSEYPEMTKRFFEAKGVRADVRLSYGASEAKIPDIADCVVDITETGRALRAAGLRVIDTILTSYTEAIVNRTSYADPDKRKAMEQLMTLLNGALEARGKVLLKVNVTADRRDAVLAVLPGSQVAHRQPARQRRLCDRERGAEGRHQPRDPRTHGSGCHRSARDPDPQDRPLMISGTVTQFDDAEGLGTVTAVDGREYLFHCIEIADGTRTIDVGQAVRFQPLPRFGHFQAGRVAKV